MKAKKSIVICTTDDTHKLTIIGEEKVVVFNEPLAVQTLIKAYAHIYKLICKDLLNEHKFTCSFCKLILHMEKFSGVVMRSDSNELLLSCIKCSDSEVTEA